MPRITRRRPPARETPQSTHAENNEEPTQNGGGEIKTETRAKKATRKVEAATQDADGSDVDNTPPNEDLENAFKFDPSTFEDRPLGKGEEMVKLHGVIAEWRQIEKDINKRAFPLLSDVARTVVELTNDEEGEKYVQQLDPVMREIIEIQFEMSAHCDVIDDIRQRVFGGEQIKEASQVWDKGIKSKLTERQEQSARAKYGKDGNYFKFRTSIWEAKHEDAMPPINSFIAKENGEESDESDVEVGGVTQDFKCPLTLTLLEDPMTSAVCRHSFNKAAILHYLGAGPKKCPAAGCSKTLSLTVLQDDEELGKRAKADARRKERRAQQAESEDEVEDD